MRRCAVSVRDQSLRRARAPRRLARTRSFFSPFLRPCCTRPELRRGLTVRLGPKGPREPAQKGTATCAPDPPPADSRSPRPTPAPPCICRLAALGAKPRAREASRQGRHEHAPQRPNRARLMQSAPCAGSMHLQPRLSLPLSLPKFPPAGLAPWMLANSPDASGNAPPACDPILVVPVRRRGEPRRRPRG